MAILRTQGPLQVPYLHPSSPAGSNDFWGSIESPTRGTTCRVSTHLLRWPFWGGAYRVSRSSPTSKAEFLFSKSAWVPRMCIWYIYIYVYIIMYYCTWYPPGTQMTKSDSTFFRCDFQQPQQKSPGFNDVLGFSFIFPIPSLGLVWVYLWPIQIKLRDRRGKALNYSSQNWHG